MNFDDFDLQEDTFMCIEIIFLCFWPKRRYIVYSFRWFFMLLIYRKIHCMFI